MALVPDQKFSTFQDGGDLAVNDIIVGLRGGLNTRFVYTGELPTGVVIPIANGGTGASNAADARVNLGLGSIAVQDADAVAITGGSAALTTGSVLASAVAGTDIVNKDYLEQFSPQKTTVVSAASYNVLVTDNVILVETDVIAAPVSIVLPAAPTNDGQVFTIKDIGLDAETYNITITVSGGGTIGGQADYTIASDDQAVSIAWSTSQSEYYVVYSFDTLIPVLRISGNTGTAAPNIGVITINGGTTGITTTASGSTLSLTGTLNVSHGGTGVTSVTTIPTASAYAGWNANSNLSANNFLWGFATTVSAAGTTTLTVASAYTQEITGATTQTIQMPVTSTLSLGHSFKIINNSSGNVTLNSSGGNSILVMAANTTAFITCILTSGTTAASWNASYVYDNGAGVLSITGTSDQVIASAATGAVTLSLPQSIATTSAVTFDRVTFSDTTHGIVGTTTNNNAAATYVGEVISSQILFGSRVAISGSTPTNLTGINLTAGDWDVWGNIYFNTSGANNQIVAGISGTSATLPDNSLCSFITSSTNDLLAIGVNAPQQRISLSGNATYYMVGFVAVGSGSTEMSGGIYARRRR